MTRRTNPINAFVVIFSRKNKQEKMELNTIDNCKIKANI